MTRPGDPTMPSGLDATAELHVDEAYCSACSQSFPSDTKVCPNDGARLIKLAAQKDTLIGKVLEERYEIRAPLGKGGMGTVYRGWQLSVDREVAIKVIHPKLSDDRSAVKRFLREARLASRLSQPNIVNVYDFGQSDSVLFLVMELLRGRTLTAEIGNGRRLTPKRTVGIALQLCDALEAAHAQGIVHRDLKPSNIVILDDPPGRDLIKVLDFGLAKSLIQDAGSVVTNTDALLGTPLYMAPEMIEGKVSDQRADLYSLGCILFEMLTGRPPFVENAVSAVLARHISDPPAPLPAHVPARLRDLVESLLAKTPEGRIQTAGEIRRVLDEIRDTGLGAPQAFDPIAPADTVSDVHDALAETHASTPLPPSSVAISDRAPAVRASPLSSLDTPRSAPSSYRGLVVVLLLLVPAALAIVWFSMGRNQNEHDAVAPAPAVIAPADAADLAVPMAVDAGVVVTDAAIDAAIAAAIDAGIKKPRPPRPNGQPATTGPVPVTEPKVDFAPRPDAGVVLPPIDFIKKK